MQRVLIVEDDVWMASLQAEMLEEAGYDVVVAHAAAEAIESVDARVPDVIVADVLLAGSTVFSLLHELQSYQDTQRIPVVLCTTISDHFTTEQLSPYGVRRVLDKATMELDAVVTAVRVVLG